jgi:HAD superfamily hydrolase (TIGR01509 family)
MSARRVDLTAVMNRGVHLLFDFDGPICSIFATVSPLFVAKRLREVLGDCHTVIPRSVSVTNDPFDVLRFAAAISAELGERVERELHQLELKAVDSAHPTPYAREVIEKAGGSGRAIAAVSNNSRDVVGRYLAASGFASTFGAIVGRSSPDPRLLKPDPFLIDQAVKELGATHDECVLVGDSISDIEGAHRAGTLSIGYANKPGKVEQLATAGADAIITSMAHLLPYIG